jgi:CheY-like chemotaxis protein
MFPPGERIEILLIEDDAGDTLMIKEAFDDNKVTNSLTCLTDGEQAIDYLLRRGEHANAARPDLILLDLNLPRMDGRELLATLKSDPDFASIPLLVFTTSSSDPEVARAYAHHANAFLTKPIDLAGFLALVRAIDGFWFRSVRLPSR